MATYVHIADARDSTAIRRTGLCLPKARWVTAGRGVFAMPVIEDFMITHQWARELARRGHRSAVGIYFRVPDEDPVWEGMFGQKKTLTTAAAAAARLRRDRLLGYEVVISRPIRSSEIQTIRPLPLVGWRLRPDAKGSLPKCLCSYCVGGDIKSRRLRDRLDPEGRYR